MADASFDVVMVGGGNKALFLGMYLAKYGGMDVAIFERRHELGGGLSSVESPAPGFIADSHASALFEWYYEPIYEDFPDFEERGGKLGHFDVAGGIINLNTQRFFGIQHYSVDPNAERTLRRIAEFSEQDAETYQKLYEVSKPGGSFYRAYIEAFFSPPPPGNEPDPLDRWLADYLKRPDCPIDLAWTLMPANRAVQELWDTPEFQIITLRRLKSMGMPTEMTGALSSLFVMMGLCYRSFAIGGTHNIAHACQRIFVESGGKFFTKREVAKILVEHGKAKGIRLADGTEVEARKLVISTVDPQQLILELVGREHFERRLVRRIETLMGGLTCIAWYTWALHDLPDYLAAQSDPDVGQSGWTLMSAGDTQSLIDEAYLRNLGQIPPLDSELIHFGAYSLCDETRAPQGKHVVSTEFMVVPAQRLTERQWMDFKKQHAEDVLRFWQKFAPNMTWDNVIGFDPHTPYDTAACLKNMPQGDQACVDVVPGQFGRMRPTPELSRHRTPIEHLYATGCAWGLMHGASAAQGYSCYKAIADDLGLRKPWQEKGRAY